MCVLKVALCESDSSDDTPLMTVKYLGAPSTDKLHTYPDSRIARGSTSHTDVHSSVPSSPRHSRHPGSTPEQPGDATSARPYKSSYKCPKVEPDVYEVDDSGSEPDHTAEVVAHNNITTPQANNFTAATGGGRSDSTGGSGHGKKSMKSMYHQVPKVRATARGSNDMYGWDDDDEFQRKWT